MSHATKIIQAAAGASAEDITGFITDYANIQSGTNVTIDSGVAEGDVLVAEFAAESASSATVPAGYTEVIATTNFQSTGEAFVVFYKILDGTEGGTTVSNPFTGATTERQTLMIVRPSPGIPAPLTVSNLQQTTSTTSSTLTANISSSDGPCLVYHLGFSFGSSDFSRSGTRNADKKLSNGGATSNSVNHMFRTYSGFFSETSGGSQEVTFSGTGANFSMISFLLLLEDVTEFSFNTEGSDGGLEILSVTNSDFGTDDFTYEAWVYPTDLSSNFNGVVGHEFGSGGGHLYVRNDGGVQLWNGESILRAGGGTISTNQWHHIAAVRSSGTLTLYIDGTSVGSTSYTNSITSTDLFVGQSRTSESEIFQGYINRPHVLDSAKYTGNFTPSTSYTSEATTLMLLEVQGDTAVDLEGNSITNNGATFVSESPNDSE